MKIAASLFLLIVISIAGSSSYLFIKEKNAKTVLQKDFEALQTKHNSLVKAEELRNKNPYDLVTAGLMKDVAVSLSCRAGVGGSDCLITERDPLASSSLSHPFATQYDFVPFVSSVSFRLLSLKGTHALFERNTVGAMPSYGIVTYKDGAVSKYDTVLGKGSASSTDMYFARKKDDVSVEIVKVSEAGYAATTTLITLPKQAVDTGFMLGRDCSLAKAGVACADKEVFKKVSDADMTLPVTGKFTVTAHNVTTKVAEKDFVLEYRDFILK